jgi:hypothetical protein
MAAPPNVQRVINQASRRWGVSPVVLSNLLRQESGYREGVSSPAGARDIAQFIPGTARRYGVTLGDNRIQDDIFGAAHYLSDNLRKTGGNYAQALSIYNSGSPTGYLRIPETKNYVRSILSGAGQPSYAPQGGGPQGSLSGSVTPGQVKGAGFNAGSGGSTGALTALLAQLQGQPQPVQTMSLQSPGTSADQYLRTAPGFQGGVGQVSNAAQPKMDVQSLLAALGSSQDGIPQASVGNAKTTINGQAGPAAPPNKVTRIKGVANFGGKPVAGWIAPILSYARAHGWTGSVTSGYRSYQEQASIYNRGVRPAARPGTSNHEFTAFPGGAVDVSQAQQLARILRNSPYRGVLVWAGSKDPVHFSHPHGGSY